MCQSSSANEEMTRAMVYGGVNGFSDKREGGRCGLDCGEGSQHLITRFEIWQNCDVIWCLKVLKSVKEY